MANAEDVGDQLRSALTPGVTIVIADMTSTTFSVPNPDCPATPIARLTPPR